MKQKADIEQLKTKADVEGKPTAMAKQHESLLKLSLDIKNSAINTPEFMETMKAQHGEEMGVIDKMNQIGEKLNQLSREEPAGGATSEQLFQDLKAILVSKHKVTPYEFEQSKVLESLANFLTKTKQMIISQEDKKPDQEEEMKDQDLI
jgi:hypothetical protein